MTLKLLLAILLFSFCNHAIGQTAAAKKIDCIFSSYNSKTPGAAVAIVKDGKVVFKKGYGMANLEHDITITPQTVFNIASVSKQFTAFAVYLLENERRLSFEDDIRKYIPELPDYGSPVRIKHLLAHTSGIRDHGTLSSISATNITTTDQILRLLSRQQKLNFESAVVSNAQLIKAFNEASYLDNGNKAFLRVIDGDTIFHAKGQNVWKHNGVRIFSHGGHTAAFRAFLGRFPDQRLAIIQLSNDEHNERLGGRWDIADYYIKDQYAEKVQSNAAATPPKTFNAANENYSRWLDAFKGVFYSNELETQYRFEVRGNELVLSHIRLGDVKLKRTGENKFTGAAANTYPFEISFTANTSGSINGFEISNWGVMGLKFEKQQ